MRQRSSGRRLEEYARAFGVDPRPPVERADEPEPLRSFAEVRVAVGPPYLPGVLVVGGSAPGVARGGAREGPACAPSRRVGGHPFGHVGGLGEERAEEAYRAELEGEAEAVVVPVALRYERPVLVIWVEEAGEPLGVGLPGVAAV